MGLVHAAVLEEQLDQAKQETQDLKARVVSKQEIIQAQVSEIQELSQRRKSVSRNTASTNTDEKLEEPVPSESAYNDNELLQYINDLHDQLKTKEDYIETIKEEVRCSQSRIREKSLVKFSAQSIDKEIDMATNENSTSATTTDLNKNDESVESSAKNKTKVTLEKDLEGQERRIRISFLENQQAELETEIRLLKQGENVPAKLVNSGKITIGSEPFPEKVPDKIPEKRTSSGLGDSSIDSSNAELDALSKMVVDKVLEKIKNTSDGSFRGQQGQKK